MSVDRANGSRVIIAVRTQPAATGVRVDKDSDSI